MSNPLLKYVQDNAMAPQAIASKMLLRYIKRNSHDGVRFKAIYLVSQAGDDVKLKEAAYETMCETIGVIPSPMVQDEYAKICAEVMKVKQSLFYKKLKTEKEAKKETVVKEDDLKRARYVADQAERKEIDITAVDEDITTIAQSLAIFGESGRDTFHRLCKLSEEYQRADIDKQYTDAIASTKFKTAYRFFKIAETYGLEIKLPRTMKEVKDTANAKDRFKDKEETTADDYLRYGIWEEMGVYKCIDSKGGETEVSNFTMRILWHIETAGDEAYRLMAIKNIHGHEAFINMNTDNFVSVGSFKKEVARRGNFLFKGGDVELSRLQDKLQREEKTTNQVKFLGWNKKHKFFAWANGIYDVAEGRFIPIDEYGIVEHKTGERTLYHFIPALSTVYADKEDLHSNDKKFIYIDTKVTWAQWSEMYLNVYGKQGMLAMVYYVMALYSDIIFKHLNDRFPILCIYGKRGTGKGMMIQSLMKLFGKGQDQIMLGGSSTAVGFMRKFAQYINGIVWLDEYKNNLPPKIIESIKNIFDRKGYERGKKDNTFDTESTPVHSACILSGQEMPTIEPALFTRTILGIMTETKFSQEQRDRFNTLKRMEEAGLSGITVELLKHRPFFDKHFLEMYDEEVKKLIKEVNNNEIDERLFISYAALITTAEILLAKESLPFHIASFREFCKQNLKEQFFILKGSDDTSKYWDVVEQLFEEGRLIDGKHFLLKNGYLFLRVSAIYQEYAETLIRRRDPNVLDEQTLINYLQSDTKKYVGKKKLWLQELGQQVWLYQFAYKEIGVNLIKGSDENEIRWKYRQMGLEYDDKQAVLDLKAMQDEED